MPLSIGLLQQRKQGAAQLQAGDCYCLGAQVAPVRDGPTWNQYFHGSPLYFKGDFLALSYLLSGVSLSLAGSSHSALGNRRQGTLFPTLIRQLYHSRKSASLLKAFLWSCMSSYFFFVVVVVCLFIKRSNMPILTTVVN